MKVDSVERLLRDGDADRYVLTFSDEELPGWSIRKHAWLASCAIAVGANKKSQLAYMFMKVAEEAGRDAAFEKHGRDWPKHWSREQSYRWLEQASDQIKALMPQE